MFFTFLQHALSVPLSLTEKKILNEPKFCEIHIKDGLSGNNPTAHALIRAFAVANQVASTYRPSPFSPPLDPEVRIFVAPNTAESRLEALALLASLLTTWADNDEARFQAYVNASVVFNFNFINNSSFTYSA